MREFIDLLKASSEQYNKLAQRLVDETMTLGEFDKLIRINNDFENDTHINDKWQDYIDTLINSKDILVKERKLNKLKNYLKLVNLNHVTQLLVEIKSKNQLTGNFEMLNELINSLSSTDGASFSKKLIKDLDERTIDKFSWTKKLDEFSSDVNFVKCLEKYIDNYAFIEWLRAKVPDLNSLKLLTEFASDDENWREFQLVGMGYSALIYELPIDSSYNDLIECLNQVYRYSLKNSSLAENIVRCVVLSKSVKRSIVNICACLFFRMQSLVRRSGSRALSRTRATRKPTH